MKYGLLSNHLLQRKQEHGSCWKERQVKINFCQNTMHSSYHKE